MIEFDFGPISRTDAGGRKDSFNLAALPLHEAMDALLAATNRDELVAWLWHDLFKPLFYWPQPDKWHHIPGLGHFKPSEARFAGIIGVPTGMVRTHQGGRVGPGEQKFSISEGPIIEDQFDQVALGTRTRFLQLAFLAEPATNTALLRAIIADAFAENVTKATAMAIVNNLATWQPTFKQVRYVFEFGQEKISKPPASREIEALRDRYGMKLQGDELVIHHVTPVISPDFDGRRVEVVIDFTDAPPTPERFEQGIISLVELLTVYQDSRTILMGIPQFLPVDVQQLKQRVKDATEQRLQVLDMLTTAPETKVKSQAKSVGRMDWSALPLIRKGQDVDLLAHMFAEQVEIRLIDPNTLPLRSYQTSQGKTVQARLLNEVVSWPIELLQGKSRRCRFCNTMFDSALPAAEVRVGDAFSPDFTDIEHVGFGGDICPMCRIYALNSHKSRTVAEKAQGTIGDRKAYRGAFALLSPSSHFTSPGQSEPEQPPLDIGGRFANPLQRVTVTLQEFALFNSLSRRVIGEIWRRLNDGDGTQPMPLPYLGAILLTQNEAWKVRTLFNHFEVLFDEAVLRAYPFKVTVQPAIELAFEMAVNDLEKHHTKHTYLKTSPIIVAVDPRSKFTLLVDNGLQLEVSHEFFENLKQLRKLLGGIEGLERQQNWLLAVLQGEDPVTATAEAFYDRADRAFWQAESVFWDTHMSAVSPAEQWRQYEKMHKEVKCIVSKYPMLIEFFTKPRRR
jgi:hypothetical protein